MPLGTQQTDEQRPLLEGSTPTYDNAVHRDAEAAPTPDPTSAVDEEGGSTWKFLSIMGCIYLGTFLAAADSTLVATLSAPISSEFGSLTLLSWLATGYLIANSALQPLAGKLTDIFGRRAGLIFGNVFFAAGNLICGLARNESAMIAGRVVAGMGGGAMTAISTIVASDLIPLRKRGIWQGFGNISFGAGSALGGVIGGVLNDSIGWRWAFLIQVPVTLVSLLFIVFLVNIPIKDTGENRWKRVDYMGALLLVSTLVVLLLGLNSGGNVVPWSHPLVLTTLPLSAVLLLVYIYVEANVAPEPVIPVRLLVNRTLLAGCFTNWFGAMAMFGILFYLPMYFQVQGDSASVAGAKMVPNAVGIAVGSLSVGMLMRWWGKYWWLSVAVQFMFLLGNALLSSLQDDTPPILPYIYLFFTGTGYVGMLTCTLIALISAVDHKHQAVVTSASYAFRSTGSTIGITIASTIFQNVLSRNLWDRLGDRKGAEDIIPRVRNSLDEIKKLPADWKDVVVGAYVDAFRVVFLALLGLTVLGAVSSLAMREHKLHSTISRRDS